MFNQRLRGEVRRRQEFVKRNLEEIMMTRISDVDRTFAAFEELRRRMERVFDDEESRAVQGPARGFFEAFDFGTPRTIATWPRLSVYDTGSTLVLHAEVPGLKESDLKIEIAQDVLSISGERKSDAPEGYAVHRRERAPVKFARSLALPCKVDVDKATATVTDGVLTLTLPKTPEAQPRQITVKAVA
jgi:HSP20 family protein